MSVDPTVAFWIAVGAVGLGLCIWVLRRKRRYLLLVPRNEPPGLLARLLIAEERVRLTALLIVLGIGILAVLRVPSLGRVIGYLLIGVEVLIVVPSLLWLRYERRMGRLRRRAERQEER